MKKPIITLTSFIPLTKKQANWLLSQIKTKYIIMFLSFLFGYILFTGLGNPLFLLAGIPLYFFAKEKAIKNLLTLHETRSKRIIKLEFFDDHIHMLTDKVEKKYKYSGVIELKIGNGLILYKTEDSPVAGYFNPSKENFPKILKIFEEKVKIKK